MELDDEILERVVALLLTRADPASAPHSEDLQIVRARLARWADLGRVRRASGDLQFDVVARSGGRAAIEARLPADPIGAEVEVFVDGVSTGSARIDERRVATVVIHVHEVGVHEVIARTHRGETTTGVLQVVDHRPVVLVDVALLGAGLASDSAIGTLVLGLMCVGVEVVYFDTEPGDRRMDIRAALRASSLPPAAILKYEGDAGDFETFGVFLAPAFAQTGVRRSRARGVPVAAAISHNPRLSEATAGVPIYSVDAAKRLLADSATSLHEWARKFEQDRSRSDARRWWLDCMTGVAPVYGNTVTPEFDNRRARARVYALIEDARRSIHVQFFIVRRCAFTDGLLARLIARARAGVSVRFVADALFSENDVYREALADVPNAEWVTIRPIESVADVNRVTLRHRDHRKVLIVDGAVAIVTGRNAGDEYYVGFDELQIDEHTTHDHVPWLDAHVELTGPIVAEVQRSFLQTWDAHGGGPTSELDERPPAAADPAGVPARFVVHHGLVDIECMSTYEALLDAAESHVYIVNDFPIVDVLERAIRRALARGVRVDLLTGNAAARHGDGTALPAPLHRRLFEYMVKARLEPLMVAGANVYEFTTPKAAGWAFVRPYVHAKVMSVDGQVASVGSANLDAAASYWESEAIIVVEDEGFAAGIERQIRALLAHSHRLDVQSEGWLAGRTARLIVGRLWPDWFYS